MRGRTNAIIQMDLYSEKELAEFESVSAASKILKIDPGNIIAAARGTRGSAGGFKWKFKLTDHSPESQGKYCQKCGKPPIEAFIVCRDCFE